jgi:hypothetical protein
MEHLTGGFGETISFLKDKRYKTNTRQLFYDMKVLRNSFALLATSTKDDTGLVLEGKANANHLGIVAQQ